MKLPELTVNWHILEACNYDCCFCYAKFGQRSIFSSRYQEVISEISKLAGQEIQFKGGSLTPENIRLNFAGGEPFLESCLGEAITFASKIGLRPSFVSNGSLLTNDFIEEFGPMISVAGFSIDSFNHDCNSSIGRSDNRGRQVNFDRINEIFDIFRSRSPRTSLKINTVVCKENVNEDLSAPLKKLRADRWKILRVIPIHGARNREIADEDFESFLKRHQDVPGRVVPEDNRDMHRSYVMLDPDGRFYQREGSEYLRSLPILDVGVLQALRNVEFDVDTYKSRY